VLLLEINFLFFNYLIMAKKRSAMTTIVILLIILVILLSVKLFITMQSLKSCQISISSSQKQMVNVNKNNQPKVEKKVVKNTEQTKTVVKS
jgi:predicted Holliday junction resolvase-like endonuclease